MNSKKVAVIIPSLDPNKGFMDYCNELLRRGIDRLIIIDDGSKNKDFFDFPTDDIETNKIVLLRHYINLGKGRSLKDAFNYYMNMSDLDEFCGLITVDSDGQHSIEDVLKMKNALLSSTDYLILGARDFDSGEIPFKSCYGNRITRVLFFILHGVKLKDTQTGMRAIPTKIAPYYIDLYGERFEYETNMLVFSAKNNIPIKEVPIHTIYIDNNTETHFRPFQDSAAIYRLLFKTFLNYAFSSLSSFVLDILFFKFFLLSFGKTGFALPDRIIIATIIARLLSSIYNYFINHKLVFHSSKRRLSTLLGYYSLCIIQMLISGSAVAFIVMCFNTPETPVKIIVDSCLFIISFYIQKNIVFRGK